MAIQAAGVNAPGHPAWFGDKFRLPNQQQELLVNHNALWRLAVVNDRLGLTTTIVCVGWITVGVVYADLSSSKWGNVIVLQCDIQVYGYTCGVAALQSVLHYCVV